MMAGCVVEDSAELMMAEATKGRRLQDHQNEAGEGGKAVVRTAVSQDPRLWPMAFAPDLSDSPGAQRVGTLRSAGIVPGHQASYTNVRAHAQG